jgi:hypothetical protein
MTRSGYVRISNDLGGDERFAELTEEHYLAAVGLWLHTICYCDRQRSDGHIPSAAMRRAVAPGMDITAPLAELERVGLVKATETGWEIPKYLDWQRSREQIDGARDQRREAGRRSAEARANQTDRQTDIHTPPLNDSLNDSLTAAVVPPRHIPWEELDR